MVGAYQRTVRGTLGRRLNEYHGVEVVRSSRRSLGPLPSALRASARPLNAVLGAIRDSRYNFFIYYAGA